MRRHVHQEVFDVAPEHLFAILHTPSAIRSWWGARTVVILPEPGGYWCATWGESEDEPEYVTCARLVTFEPPRRMTLGDYRYFARTGPLSFDTAFETVFEVESQPGGSLLRVVQDGFPDEPDADDFYEACRVGWRETFAGIRRFLSH